MSRKCQGAFSSLLSASDSAVAFFLVLFSLSSLSVCLFNLIFLPLMSINYYQCTVMVLGKEWHFWLVCTTKRYRILCSCTQKVNSSTSSQTISNLAFIRAKCFKSQTSNFIWSCRNNVGEKKVSCLTGKLSQNCDFLLLWPVRRYD